LRLLKNLYNLAFMAHILDGKIIRDAIRNSLKQEVQQFLEKENVIPALAIIQVGTVEASSVFIRMKKAFGESIGVKVFHFNHGEDASEQDIIREIERLNKDSSVHGIIVQLPLPSHIRPEVIIETIDPLKDADGLHSKSKILGTLPATTRGVLTLLSYYKIDLVSKNVLVVGRSKLVGMPTAIALLEQDATVTVAHKLSENLKELCLRADLIVVATGNPGLITLDMVRDGQVIVDIGITSVEGKVRGDVDFEQVKHKVQAITPVPGGVGPLTVASLFQNLIDLYKNKYK